MKRSVAGAMGDITESASRADKALGSAGRVTTGASLASADVTGALGYAPANKAGESFTGSISVVGTITATGDITAYSDASLKTDVATISNALGLVNSLRGVSFKRIASGNRGIGVIAQELAAVVPEPAPLHIHPTPSRPDSTQTWRKSTGSDQTP